LALDDQQGGDVDRDFELTLPGVKVRRPTIIELKNIRIKIP